MGVDYRYAGSASYPRFDKEICEIAKIFSGEKTEYLIKREKNSSNESTLDYWFGFLKSDSKETNFVFPKGTDETLVKWLNDPYAIFDEKETKVIWNHISNHPEIEDISDQIWRELETLVECGHGWIIL